MRVCSSLPPLLRSGNVLAVPRFVEIFVASFPMGFLTVVETFDGLVYRICFCARVSPFCLLFFLILNLTNTPLHLNLLLS